MSDLTQKDRLAMQDVYQTLSSAQFSIVLALVSGSPTVAQYTLDRASKAIAEAVEKLDLAKAAVLIAKKLEAAE